MFDKSPRNRWAMGTRRCLTGTALAVSLASTPNMASAIVTYEDPNLYVPNPGQFSGVAKLSITRVDGTEELCSGVLISGGRILTAAHCLTKDGMTASAASLEVAFDSIPGAPVTSSVFVWHEDWTGDPNASAADIGVIKLTDSPPAGAVPYELPDQSFENPLLVEIAGYGEIGLRAVDMTLPDGFLHVGANHYDAPPDSYPDSLKAYKLYDFDNYSTGANQIGEPGWVTVIGRDGPIQAIPMIDFDGDGTFVRAEAIIGHGDSGGPTILDRFFIVGIHSWVKNNLSGDAFLLADINDGFLGEPGAVAGDVNVAAFADWIAGVTFDAPPTQPPAVPAPGGALLLVAGLLGVWLGRRP